MPALFPFGFFDTPNSLASSTDLRTYADRRRFLRALPSSADLRREPRLETGCRGPPDAATGWRRIKAMVQTYAAAAKLGLAFDLRAVHDAVDPWRFHAGSDPDEAMDWAG